jgi:hypothetical protein
MKESGTYLECRPPEASSPGQRRWVLDQGWPRHFASHAGGLEPEAAAEAAEAVAAETVAAKDCAAKVAAMRPATLVGSTMSQQHYTRVHSSFRKFKYLKSS